MMTSHAGLIGDVVVAASVALGAQNPPPVNGVTGTIALEGTTRKVYTALNVVVVRTIDGVEHAIHYTDRDLNDASNSNAKVVVYYTDDAGHKVAHFFKRVS